MPNWIERIAEPKRLFLAWQAPDHLVDRFRWAVADLVRTEADLELGLPRHWSPFRGMQPRAHVRATGCARISRLSPVTAEILSTREF